MADMTSLFACDLKKPRLHYTALFARLRTWLHATRPLSSRLMNPSLPGARLSPLPEPGPTLLSNLTQCPLSGTAGRLKPRNGPRPAPSHKSRPTA